MCCETIPARPPGRCAAWLASAPRAFSHGTIHTTVELKPVPGLAPYWIEEHSWRSEVQLFGVLLLRVRAVSTQLPGEGGGGCRSRPGSWAQF